MALQLSMVGLVVEDMGRSLAFYRRLGLAIPAGADDRPHVEVKMESGITFFWDTTFVRTYDPDREPPAGGSRILPEFFLADRGAVAAAYADMTGHGYQGHQGTLRDGVRRVHGHGGRPGREYRPHHRGVGRYAMGVGRDERHVVRLRVVDGMRSGCGWREAIDAAGLKASRATAYRLARRARLCGDNALRDERRGHAHKLGDPARAWVATYCRGAPHSAGGHIQAALQDRFGLSVSISQINRVRATLGLSRRARGAGGKSTGRSTAHVVMAGWRRRPATPRRRP